ncbi:MAG: sigma-70 family RNA polymerase sigma factor [Planctomycetes bacterium]|nr:sigma-70 family RNA polymerase sigma factor [Planctomycetota bacterium]
MDPRDPDVQLMLRLQAGDGAALGELLRRNAPRVLALAFRYLGDRAAAEDVVQETFLKLYQARDRYRSDAPFGAYVLRIATNVCLSQLRKKRPRSLDEGDDGERASEPPADGVRAPEETLLDEELAGRVRDAVQQLPDRQRMAILLNKFEGLDYQQVADQLGLTVPATKSLLHRARMTLKDLLEGYLGGVPSETQGPPGRSPG